MWINPWNSFYYSCFCLAWDPYFAPCYVVLQASPQHLTPHTIGCIIRLVKYFTQIPTAGLLVRQISDHLLFNPALWIHSEPQVCHNMSHYPAYSNMDGVSFSLSRDPQTLWDWNLGKLNKPWSSASYNIWGEVIGNHIPVNGTTLIIMKWQSVPWWALDLKPNSHSGPWAVEVCICYSDDPKSTWFIMIHAEIAV